MLVETLAVCKRQPWDSLPALMMTGYTVNFERWTFKSVKTCIKKTIELYKSYPDIYADTLNKTVKVIAYSTPNGYTRQQAVWTATIDEFKMLINNFY